jgi:protein ImuB
MVLKSSTSYSLWDSPTDEQTSQLKPKTENEHSELWMAVHLPKLALEVVTMTNNSKPIAVIEEINSKQVIHIVSEAAEKTGIVSGMSLSAAFTLCSDLETHQIKPLAQQQRLQDLAGWALQFTPRISLHLPDSLLLEIAGSIKYFKELDIIQKQISDALKNRWKHNFYLAVSPTPEASILLAKSGKQIVVKNISNLRSVLGDLSIALLPLDKKSKKQLTKIGVRILRDLWRLPSAALARRFNINLINYLERTLGKQSSPLASYRAPKHFQATYDTPHEIENYQLLLPCAYKLLNEFCDFLKKSDMYVSNFVFYFKHPQCIPTIIDISLRQPLRNSEYFMILLETKLQQTSLVAPVIGVNLLSEALHAYTAKTFELFSNNDIDAEANGNIASLLEQLYARLDHELIKDISCREDQRPEYASSNIKPGKQASEHIKKPRPFWLLPEPKQLLIKNNRLYYKSIIHFSVGPERIEAGWWDDGDIQRDYYIGIDEVAGSLWIYHDLKEKKYWYLHGLFG